MLDAVTPALGAVVTGYGLLAGASSLLQARRMLRRGTSSDVSLAFLSLYVAGYALWLLYGLAIGSLPLILVDAVGLLCGACTLGVAMLLRRRGRGSRAPTEPVGLPSSHVEASRIGRPVAFHRFASHRRRRSAQREPIPVAATPTSPGSLGSHRRRVRRSSAALPRCGEARRVSPHRAGGPGA
jgi:MtN3 and saliva related transmembrane protein